MVDSDTRISIVIPCYNGANSIGTTLDSLLEYAKRTNMNCELIVVDDGSTDQTASIVREQYPDVGLISLEQNCGKGQAVRVGMLQATGEIRFFMDADAPFDLEVLETFLRYLDFKEFDVAIGSREHGNYEKHTQRKALRRISSTLMAAFVSRVLLADIRDTQCGLKGFRAEAAEYLFREGAVTGFAFDIELLYLSFKNNFDIKRIPVTLVRDDQSTVSVLRHGTRMLFDIFSVVIRFYRGVYKPYGDRFYGVGSF